MIEDAGAYKVGAGIGASLVGLIWGARVMFLSWRQGDVQNAGMGAQQALLKQLHDELLRMAGQNEAMSHQVTLLHGQVGQLTAENAGLKHSVEALHNEVVRLRALLAQRETPDGMHAGGGFS
jgi:small-conductance mechanosensitive channel